MRIEFFIPIEVLPKQSFRMTRTGHRYQPQKLIDNANELRFFAAHWRPDHPMAGPIRADYIFQFEWRKSEPKRNRLEAKPKDTKPDADNLAKQINDVLEVCGFFEDDSSIAELKVRKVWTDAPGVQVVVEEIT